MTKGDPYGSRGGWLNRTGRWDNDGRGITTLIQHPAIFVLMASQPLEGRLPHDY